MVFKWFLNGFLNGLLGPLIVASRTSRLFAHGTAADFEGAIDVSLLLGQQHGHILSEKKREIC